VFRKISRAQKRPWECGQTPDQLAKAIREGLQHEGFAIIEVVGQRLTQAGRHMRGTDRPSRFLKRIMEYQT
jgi:hypothetical protein